MNKIISSSTSHETFYFARWLANSDFLVYFPEFDNNALKENAYVTSVVKNSSAQYASNDVSIYSLNHGAPPISNASTLFLMPDTPGAEVLLDAFAMQNLSYQVALYLALLRILTILPDRTSI